MRYLQLSVLRAQLRDFQRLVSFRRGLRRVAVCAAAILVLVATFPVRAQQAPAPAPDPGQLRPRTAGQSLSSRLSVVNFAVVAGRIDATGTEAGLEREQSITGADDHQEKLSLSTNADQEASIEYELSTASETVAVDVVDGWQLTLSRRPTKSGHEPVVEFVQPHEGILTLTVTDGGKVRKIEGASLWHLLLAEPQICNQYLLPLLDMLRSDWRLAETAHMIEAQMVRTARAYQPETLRAAGALVADLASDQFNVRQGAERQLRAAGLAVIPYLETLDRGKLDFEQSTRISRIIDSRPDVDEDTPEVTGNCLMTDRQIWLAFADRPQLSVRRAAGQELAFLLNRPIRFEPDAAADIRQAQLTVLRTQLESKNDESK